jgi:curved DNA-binding protein CbpA
MAKIHTHYDNLKVARLAPQEVIRAAYKALSQKYHPDKNPGDEKAARIMAILNSAYGTLADPQRRREHDEWIAAEEWEIEWLESTRHEDARGKQPRQEAPSRAWDDSDIEQPSTPIRRPRWGGWKRWTAFGGCLLVGWGVGLLMSGNSATLGSLLGGPFDSGLDMRNKAKSDADPKAELRADTRVAKVVETRSNDAIVDGWAVAKAASAEPAAPRAPEIHVVAVAQVRVPPLGPECQRGPQSLVAPNGEAWPQKSGYVDGYPIWNKGQDFQLTVDNGANAAAAFVRVFDQERHTNVRHLYVLAHDKFVLDNLTIGKYELHYQNVVFDGPPASCEPTRSPVGTDG